jgi:alkaline phosphatase D
MAPEDLVEPRRGLQRREFLMASAAAGLTLAAPINYAAIARAKKVPIAAGGQFAHGVASGFPSTRAITLWTRVNELTKSSKVTLEVAGDAHFKHVVHRGQAIADAARDFTVHARVKGLKPAHEYHYRFHTKDKNSRVGKFRTLPPADSNHPVRIGFYSCQDYEAGYYNALAGLAKEKDLDIVLCLGDYIYEHMYYDGPDDRVDKTGPNQDGDVQTLPEYRQKYRLYQSDKNLQDMHAAHPFLAVWDDHEVEDNYAGSGADSKQSDPTLENSGYPRRVPFAERRKNGYKAHFEAMPRIAPKNNIIYGSVRLGKMVELFVTDQRQYRDPQPCQDALLTSCPDDMAPGRNYLGGKQKTWLKGAVPKSKARWNLLGSQCMMMALDASPGQHANQDQWDGYSAEREEILNHFHDRKVKNLVVLSGDIHTFIAGNLGTNGEQSGKPIGTELVGGSITSLGLADYLGVPAATLEGIRKAADPHTIYADFEKHGYCVVTAKKDELLGEFKAVATTLQRGSPTTSLAKFRVKSGTPKIQKV